jgi:hypothetical protein
MKITATSILFLTILFFTLVSFGQNPKNQEVITKSLKSESIQNQFNTLVTKSNDWHEFKLIKRINLNKFKANFLDSLKASNQKYLVATTKIQDQKKQIETLNNDIAKVNGDLSTVNSEKDSMGLFGLRLSKSSYNILLWSIVLGLLFTTLFFLFRFNNSNAITKQTKASFNEIEEEFETHKKNSLEREQVLRRKLQDEINRQRNV